MTQKYLPPSKKDFHGFFFCINLDDRYFFDLVIRMLQSGNYYWLKEQKPSILTELLRLKTQ